MNKVYQVVTETETKYFTKNELLASFDVKGYNFNPAHRDELRGEPILNGFQGPMYNGINDDGACVIRYESPEVYRALGI